jgi:hypothetical protein
MKRQENIADWITTYLHQAHKWLTQLQNQIDCSGNDSAKTSNSPITIVVGFADKLKLTKMMVIQNTSTAKNGSPEDRIALLEMQSVLSEQAREEAEELRRRREPLRRRR